MSTKTQTDVSHLVTTRRKVNLCVSLAFETSQATGVFHRPRRARGDPDLNDLNNEFSRGEAPHNSKIRGDPDLNEFALKLF